MYNYYCTYGVIALTYNKLSSTQIAIIAAIFTVIGDVFALLAALAAFNEEQQSKE
jgi:NADH:ubiquinone oxidoreductase subunit 5 (subunit L)/multisubunit Na+/H+ antiporter MnhA subunit